MLGLFIIYFILFAYLAHRRLDWAVGIIIFSLWSYLIRFDVLGLPVTLLEIMIWLVAAFWLEKAWPRFWSQLKNNIKERRVRQRYPFDWEMVLLLIISLVAVGTAGWSLAAWGIWKAYFFEPLLLFIVVFNVFGQKDYGRLIWPLAWSSFLVSVVTLWQKITGWGVVIDFWTKEAQRATSLFDYPNAVGLFLAPICLVLVGYAGYKWKSEDRGLGKMVKIVVLLLIALLSILAIVAAQSDGALVAVLAGLLVFGWLSNKRLAIVTSLLVIVAGAWLWSQPVLKQRVWDKITLFDLSGQIRQQQWTETWQMLQDGRLITGAGLSNYQTTVAPYHQEGIFVKNHDPNWLDKVRNDLEYNKQAWQPTEIYLYPHNIALNFWSELGLAGLLLFTWLIIKAMVMALTNAFGYSTKYHNKYLALGLLGALVVIVVHGLVDVPYFKNDLAGLFWLLLALIGLIQVRNRQKTV